MNYTVTDRRASMLYGPDGYPLASNPALEIQAAMGSFQGAGSSTDRGYVYLPTLDSKKEVDAWSRLELLKRSHYVYNSGGGLMQRGVDGVSRMICGTGLLPHPTPTKIKGREQKTRDWVRRRRELYMERAGSANTYDLSRRRNVFQCQRAVVRSWIKDGDIASVLAREPSINGVRGRLRRKLYESHQIGNGTMKGVPANSGWHDGVLCGPHNEPLAYRLLGEVNGRETVTDVPADNVLFTLNDQRINQVRGLTRLYSVVNKVLDRGEILHAITKGIKTAQQVAYVIEQQMHQQQQQVAGGAGSLIPKPTTVIETPDGKKVNLETFLGGGEAWGLAPGQQFKVVGSNNPTANVADYLKEMVRDVAWAIGYWPEILWSIIELGGANARFVQADLAQQIEVEQDQLVDQYLGPDYVADTYDMIEAGELDEIDGWEKHVWIAPARLTVDFGRDGKLYIEELKRGIRTMKSMYGMRGEEWQIEIDQYLDERQYISQGIYDRKIRQGKVDREMTYEEAFPEQRQGVMESPGSRAEQQAQEAKESTQAIEQRLEAMETKLTSLHHAVQFAREPKN